jgi:hypothetical protein
MGLGLCHETTSHRSVRNTLVIYCKLRPMPRCRIFAYCVLAIWSCEIARAQRKEPLQPVGAFTQPGANTLKFDANSHKSKAGYTDVHQTDCHCSRGIGVRAIRPDLRHALQNWQHKLQLADWSIEIEIVDDQELGGAAVGDIQWDLGSKRASIRILREADYDFPVGMARLDQQATILHELVHLVHASTRDRRGADEASVIRQTNALLLANRKWRILAVQEQ